MTSLRHLVGLVAVAAIAMGLAACGSDDEGGEEAGGTDASAAIEGCLDEAGISVISSQDVNELEPEQVDAGAEAYIQATDTEDPTSQGEFLVFGSEEDATAYGEKQKDELGYITETYGTVAMTTFEDDIAREDFTRCAEEAG